MPPPENIGLHEMTEKVSGEDTHDRRTTCASKFRPFLGFLFTFLTCLSYALAAVIIKKLPYISPGELTLFRNVGILSGALPVAAYCGDVLGERRWRPLLLLRAFLGGLGLLFMTTSVAYLPLAEATTIMSTFPVATAVLARVFLGEPCGPSQSALLVLTVCGVLLAVRLPVLLGADHRGEVVVDGGYALGLCAAIGSVFTQSSVFVIVRRVRHLHFSVPMLYYGVVGAVVSASVTAATDEFVAPLCGRDRALAVLVGVLGCLGNLLNTVSVQVEGAGIVAALRTMQIVLAMVFQIAFFDSLPDAYNVCGGLIVMAALSAMGLRKWMLTLPDESKLRKWFKYLLY